MICKKYIIMNNILAKLRYGPNIYEVIENGKKINSQKLKLPSGKILKGKSRKLFEVSKIKIDVLKSELISKLY